jgi:hypothetical protein
MGTIGNEYVTRTVDFCCQVGGATSVWVYPFDEFAVCAQYIFLRRTFGQIEHFEGSTSRHVGLPVLSIGVTRCASLSRIETSLPEQPEGQQAHQRWCSVAEQRKKGSACHRKPWQSKTQEQEYGSHKRQTNRPTTERLASRQALGHQGPVEKT